MSALKVRFQYLHRPTSILEKLRKSLSLFASTKITQLFLSPPKADLEAEENAEDGEIAPGAVEFRILLFVNKFQQLHVFISALGKSILSPQVKQRVFCPL